MSKIYPLKLKRRLSPRLWGGKKLEPFLNLPAHDGAEPLGEAWQVYAENHILNGEYAEQSLADLALSLGADLLGHLSVKRYGNKFPLLAKFIDAADKLSIQVHPDDVYARTQEAASGHLGKTEAWYILAAEPGAKIIWGFKDALSKDELRRAIAQEQLEPHLNVVAVKAGDVIFNPAGTVHAIGAGIFLFEIQQSSDLTYRLYDFGRRDASGQLRELHIDKALDVADLRPGQHAKVMPKALSVNKTELISTQHFAMERWSVEAAEHQSTNLSSFEILTVIEGELALKVSNDSYPLVCGESVVLPASLGAYVLRGKAEVLRCYVPDS
jgi:mannose-6-phosphate isomerase